MAQESYVMLLEMNKPLPRSAMASKQAQLELTFSVQGGKRGRHWVVSVCVDGTRPLKS